MRYFISMCLLVSAAACGDDPRTPPPITYEPVGTNNGEPVDVDMTNNGATNNGATNNGVATNNGASNNGVSNNNGTSGGLPTGETCPEATTDSFRGLCDPVRAEGCSAPEQCIVALLINGPKVDVSSACIETDRHVLSEGSFCDMTEERCEPSTFCISYLQECRRLCYLADGAGCEAHEWCVQPDENWKGLGYCADACE